jgi:hypothetical protein
MPFWGVESGPKGGRVTVTYMLDNPFSNLIEFTSGKSSLGMTLTHSFPSIPAWGEPFTVTICFDSDAIPITPALRFRRSLGEAHFIVPLVDKIARVPRTAGLIGAVHAYIWSSGPITAWDAEPAAWLTLSRRIVSESRSVPGSTGAWVKARLSAADWKVVMDAASEQYSYPYLRQEMSRVLSLLHDLDPSRIETSFGDLLRPPGSRGGGISTRLIDDIRAAGIGRMLLTADGWEQVERRPDVAAYAESSGFLFGTYDSFDSVHDPAYAGTDLSWPTAQFGQELFEAGRILDSAGNPRGGFRKIGFKLSPLAARAAVEVRVRRNFAVAPYSYYFVDADAFGDWYDDYTFGRMASAHEDARARVDRLRWISDTFKVPVGSEGGNYLMTPVITVAEGIFVPDIGWGDLDMTSKGSPWYMGAYYPPDGPDVFLKSVPLKESYIHLFIDPRFRVPLYETVFHDSVITSAHFKRSEVFQRAADAGADPGPVPGGASLPPEH